MDVRLNLVATVSCGPVGNSRLQGDCRAKLGSLVEARGAREAEEVGWGSGSGGNRENRWKPSVETIGKQTKTM